MIISANEKFLKGIVLTDEELKELLNFYEELLNVASCLDPAFSLFEKELLRRHNVLESFKIARGDE